MFYTSFTSEYHLADQCFTRWIAGKISEILGSEDDVVIELCFNLLEGSRFVRQLSTPGTTF